MFSISDTDMEIFERPYYILNNRLLKLVGLWPYQRTRSCLFRSYVVAATMIFFIGAMFIQICTCNGDTSIMIEVATTMMVAINIVLKFYTYHIGVPNMRMLLDTMIADWNTWTSKEEIKILEKYARKGQFYTIAYAITIYVATFIYILLPVLSPIMDAIAPLNESRPIDLPIKVEYFINEEKHFAFMYFHVTCSILMGITTFTATDGQFFVFMCHLCSIFTIVGYRLEHLPNVERAKDSSPRRRKDACFKHVELSIRGHKRAIEFANRIESSFSYPLLAQCGINVIDLSITLYKITDILSFSPELIKYIGFLIGQVFHIFCMSYFGQLVTNHSNEIFYQAYSGPWYNRPMSISKLLLLVMQSSYKPIKFTAGKIFVLSLEGFATIVQTSTSYFMVLLSFR